MNSITNEPIKNVICSNLHTNSKDAPKAYRTWKILYAKQPTLDKSPVEFKNKSNERGKKKKNDH